MGLSGGNRKWRWSLFRPYMNVTGTPFADSPLSDSERDVSVGATIGWLISQSERGVKPKSTSPGGEFEIPLFGL